MQFNSDGLLDPGDYPMTIGQLKNSMLVVGPPDIPEWDTRWRMFLVNNLEIMVNQLSQVQSRFPGKIGKIFIDGSFVTDKCHPNDIDGYFECDYKFLASGDLQMELNRIDLYKIWTWNNSSRRPHYSSTKGQLPMWHQYRIELYPHFGQLSGIRDQFGHELQFPSAFRQTRSHKPKGIIEIIK